jgi:hypothetical protein
MSCQTPVKISFNDVKSGCTFHGKRWDHGTGGLSDERLARVVVVATNQAGEDTTFDSLDSSGVTILNDTGGSWSYQWDPITRVAQAPGIYSIVVYLYPDIDEDGIADDSDDYRVNFWEGTWKVR